MIELVSVSKISSVMDDVILISSNEEFGYTRELASVVVDEEIILYEYSGKLSDPLAHGPTYLNWICVSHLVSHPNQARAQYHHSKITSNRRSSKFRPTTREPKSGRISFTYPYI